MLNPCYPCELNSRVVRVANYCWTPSTWNKLTLFFFWKNNSALCKQNEQSLSSVEMPIIISSTISREHVTVGLTLSVSSIISVNGGETLKIVYIVVGEATIYLSFQTR